MNIPNPPASSNYDSTADHPVLEGHDDPNVLIVLSALGYTFTKTVHPDGAVAGNDHATWFDVKLANMAGIGKLENILCSLARQRESFPIRGAVRSDLKTWRGQVRRKSAKGDEHQYIVDAARNWVMIDIDGSDFYLPDNWIEDQEATIRGVITTELPEAFHKAAVVAQWSSSMRATGGTAKVHLWFWLSRPTWSLELKHWLHDQDTSVFHPAQEHFTAAPIFRAPARQVGFFMQPGAEDASLDPLGNNRVFRLDGTTVAVPCVIPQPTGNTPLSGNAASSSSQFVRYLSTIGDHEGGGGLHRPIRDAALSFASTNEPGADWDKFRAIIRQAVQDAYLDPAKRKPDEIENRIGAGLEHNIKTAITRVERMPNRYKRRLTQEEVDEMAQSMRRVAEQGETLPGFDTSFFDA
jgi:hypothetical protein